MARLLTPLAFLLVGAAAAWWGLSGDSAETVALRQEVAELQEDLAQREFQLDMLRARSRVAQLEVLEQYPDPSSRSGLRTRFRFVEIDREGRSLSEGQEFTIDGALVYLDAQVIKFDDRFVESQDLLRGSSLLLFRRIFGEYQNPADGFVIDSVGERPLAYAPESGANAFQEELWANFWEYANDPAVSRQSGVRAMHGEAPYIKLVEGKRYSVELRHAGGLSISVLN